MMFSKNRYYQGPVSDHFDGKRFYNPGLPLSDKSLLDLLRWRILGKRSPWPKTLPAHSGLHPVAQVDGLFITAIGHASLLIQVAGCNVLLDPVWAERASPFKHIGPRRCNPPAVALANLPPIHAVLITHNHYDHLDTGTIRALWDRHRPLILTPLGNDAIIGRAAPSVEVTTGDWWNSFPVFDNVRATIVPSYHWSSRWLGDKRMALWGGFILETPVGVIYCAGDTAYRDGKIFHEVEARFGSPIVAILPIGAYAPRWFMQTQHVTPEEAVRIATDLGAKKMLGIHWGTFSLTDEPYHEPAARFVAAAGLASFDTVNAVALHAGDTWQLKPRN